MKRPRRIALTVAIVLLSVLSPLLLMAWFVEDWSRDLSTNVAWTDPQSVDETLRPVEWTGGFSGLENLIEEFAESRPHWSRPQPPEPLPEASPVRGMTKQPEGETPFHLVRTTGLMRYRDDVWVVAEPIGKTDDDFMRWRLHAHSQSRVGKGDLGQNPRNLRELLTALGELRSEKSED